MTSQRISHTTGVRSQAQRLLLIATGATVLAAAVVVGMDTWLRTGHQAGDPTGVTTPSGQRRERAIGGARTPASASFYIVSSDEEAAWLRTMLNELDVLRAQSSQPVRNDMVVVPGAGEDGDRFLRELATAERIIAEMGLPPLAVFDLRPR